MILTFILSNYLDKEFKVLLEYAALVTGLIGISSVIGGRKISSNYTYNRSKPSRRVIHAGRSDMGLINESYQFLVFMTLVAALLFAVVLVIWDQ